MSKEKQKIVFAPQKINLMVCPRTRKHRFTTSIFKAGANIHLMCLFDGIKFNSRQIYTSLCKRPIRLHYCVFSGPHLRFFDNKTPLNENEHCDQAVYPDLTTFSNDLFVILHFNCCFTIPLVFSHLHFHFWSRYLWIHFPHSSGLHIGVAQSPQGFQFAP